MTSKEKEMVIMLRRSGQSFRAIADSLKLSENTVKSYWHRHFINDTDTPAHTGFCRMCGIPLTQTPHKKERIFCSDHCRMKWWSHHPELMKKGNLCKLTCYFCKKEFYSIKSNRKYCSRRCYAEARRKAGGKND